jgi:Holliday junction resolvase YEN1
VKPNVLYFVKTKRSKGPGEAETELAELNATGVIDAVITEDSDTLVFGATNVIRL